MLRSIVLAGGLAVLGSMAAAAPLTDRFSSFWVFGDSLSDNGNLFAFAGQPPAPYFQGRFSDGPVWNEGILDDFAVGGNFAFGGATAVTNGDPIPDLSLQIGGFIASGAPAIDGARPLASLWFGANDILNAISAISVDPTAAASVLPTAVAAANAVGNGVRTLASAGIGDFAIWNLPDIGRTPLFATLQPGGALASEASSLFNTTLAGVIADLRGEGLRIAAIDTFALFNAVLADPVQFGFANTTTPCIIPGVAVCTDTTGLLYFDPIHPTAAAHAILADAFVAAVPLPGSGVLLAFGLGLLALRRRAA